ncbi:MAG: tetratricopeptide repeat protein [Cyclobacteriaceae bacterium]|nr:tetratricopeptide repeat protein [Cyclobacteriaceae bacterium]
MRGYTGFVCLILFLTYPATSWSQYPTRIDSLLRVINATPEDSVKVRALNAVVFYFIFNKPDTARLLLKQSERLTEKGPCGYICTETLLTHGAYFDVLGMPDSAEYYLNQAKDLAKVNHWYDLEERALNIAGMAHINSSKFSTALSLFTEGYDLVKSTQPENFLSQAKFLSNIGLVHQELRQFSKAIEYHQQALMLRKKYAGVNDQAISFANLGVCYKSINNYDLAIEHYKEAIRLSKLANNMRMYYALHDNLGNYQLDNEEYSKAIPYLLTALDAPESLGKNPKGQLSALSNLTTAFVQLNQPKQALQYAERALQVLTKNPELASYALTLFKSASQAHYMLNNVKMGNQYFKRYVAISDSLFSKENSNALADMAVKYETEKKEQEIALKGAQLEEQVALNQRNTLLLLFLILLLMFTGVVIILILNRNKRKVLLAQKENELKMREVQINSALNSQEIERKRFAKDIHDGFGQLITTLRLQLNHLQYESQLELRAGIFDKSAAIIDQMHNELHTMAFNLMPAVLISNGLPSALKELALQLNSAEKNVITVTSFGIQQRLPELIEINLYRITQEWINNIMKYNTAEKIDIQLVQHENSITFTIEDNGAGFNTEILNRHKGNGWQNMLSRTNLMRGKIKIDSREGIRGTTLIIELPVLDQQVHTLKHPVELPIGRDGKA